VDTSVLGAGNFSLLFQGLLSFERQALPSFPFCPARRGQPSPQGRAAAAAEQGGAGQPAGAAPLPGPRGGDRRALQHHRGRGPAPPRGAFRWFGVLSLVTSSRTFSKTGIFFKWHNLTQAHVLPKVFKSKCGSCFACCCHHKSLSQPSHYMANPALTAVLDFGMNSRFHATVCRTPPHQAAPGGACTQQATSTTPRKTSTGAASCRRCWRMGTRSV